MSRLLDALLTTDPVQRARLSQAGLAMLLLTAGVAAMHYYVWIGQAKAAAVNLWSAATLAGMAIFFVLIRSGVSRRWHEPSLTVPQMVFALTSGAIAYALVGAGRGAVFPIVMVILMFGMFSASPREMRWISLYAVALFGATMLTKSLRDPAAYPPALELGHFLLVATMMPAVSVLAGRLSRLRHRSRMQRAELAQALSRLREHTTRDELTGLVNRRHMQVVMEQEHQRCVRSGQTFCIAVLDIDRFKPVNERHGYAVGDAVIRAVAQEALRHVRASDVLARWGGEEFVLLMSDTRAALARGGLERLHQRVGALRILHGDEALGVTLSGGLAEHHAGENVMQTLERAQQALIEAKTHGRDRVVAAV
ncbi:Diguanylate cyclase [Rubrivivax sp. A210]|uniref:diguanylate cyclase n=1 Tax=Rubrivivax sp. A210 TaxID=2772301 RepID=UPI00191B2016|nr:diguanylate cyclase [Rubrivivax sp. A210]CAD5374988.1 Diguanylate cyclase [Rubrivivax sp. A210]